MISNHGFSELINCAPHYSDAGDNNTSRLSNISLPMRAEATTNEDGIIIDQPQGELKTYYKSSLGFDVSYLGVIYGPFDGLVAKVVYADNGDVYLKDPFSALKTNSWLKGKLEGDVISIQLPQPMIVYDYYGDVNLLFAEKMKFIQENGASAFVPDKDNNVAKFSIKDGVITFINEEYTNGSEQFGRILGLCDADGQWFNYGEYEVTLTPHTTAPVTAPDNMQFDTYAMQTSKDYGTLVKAKIDGDDVYFTEFPNVPNNFVVKGQVKGSTIEIPSGQYLGEDPISNYHSYFYAARLDSTYSMNYWFVEPAILDTPLILEYDADNKTMSTAKPFIFNGGNKNPKELTLVNSADFISWVEKPGTPRDPAYSYLFKYEDIYGYGYFEFLIPTIDTDGQVMDHNKLFYNIYYDDKVVTFTNDQWPLYPAATVSDIPFTYIDSDNVYGYDKGTDRGVNYFSGDMEAIGVQSIYTGCGEVRKSNIVYINVSTDEIFTKPEAGITSVVADKNIVDVKWYDLSGRSITNPTTGLYIKTVNYSDGSVKSEKQFVR